MPSVLYRTVIPASATNLTGLNATTAVTIAFWVRSVAANPNGDIIRHSSTANRTRDGYYVGFVGTGIQIIIYGSAGSSTSNFSNTWQHRNNRWAHWAVTFDNATDAVRAYFNGKLIGTGTNARDMTANASCTTDLPSGQVNSSLIGNVFDLQVIPNVAVPASDIPLLMNPTALYGDVRARWFGLQFRQPGASGTVFDESGNGNNLTASATLAACLQGEEPPWRSTYQ